MPSKKSKKRDDNLDDIFALDEPNFIPDFDKEAEKLKAELDTLVEVDEPTTPVTVDVPTQASRPPTQAVLTQADRPRVVYILDHIHEMRVQLSNGEQLRFPPSTNIADALRKMGYN